MRKEKYELLKKIIKTERWEIDVKKGTVLGLRGRTHSKDRAGYYQMATTFEGKTYVFKLHQIIMVAAGYDLVDMVVNHKNGIKTDNRIDNLEVVTQEQNFKHAWEIGLDGAKKKARGSKHGLHKLTEADVREIKKHLRLKDCTQRALAQKYGVVESKISDIKYGRTWRHVK